ncbi:MAG: CRTAC1 family protein [Pseudomonadota bacterium]|nr:CRTAC1 family protein [Pseudomonadota bacterium]
MTAPACPRLVVILLASLLLAGCDTSQTEDAAGTAAPSVPAPLFTDIAREAGLEFDHFIGASGEFYFPEMGGAGAALFDYDNDGDLDVYLVQGSMLDPDLPPEASRFAPPEQHWPGNRLFENRLIPDATLRFVDVTDRAGVGDTGYGYGVAVGDIDNDGDADLYVSNFGPNRMYRNNGDGTFADVTAESAGMDDPRWGTSASFCDYDRDRDLDLFVTNYVDFNIGANKPCNDSTGQKDYCGPMAYLPVPDSLFRNDGAGRFTDVSRSSGLGAAYGSGLGVICADFNGDAWPDIYVANDGRPNQLWINQRDGTFIDDALMSGTAYNMDGKPEASMGVTAADFDADGDLDLFMTHLINETNTLYLNDGRGNFQDATNRYQLGVASSQYTGFGTLWFDFDNDSDLDLFVANGAVNVEESLRGTPYPYQQRNQLYRNDGDASYRDISDAAGAALALFEVSRGAAFGDIDNDGDTDILVTNNNGPVRLLRNDIGNRNHWVRLRLAGGSSAVDGIGARVAITSATGTQWRLANRDGSYLSSNDPRVLVGLGKAAGPVTVEVYWPSGHREIWNDVAPDTETFLAEGTGTTVADSATP